ncbi:hypothetical protein Ddye_019821 [Dipteronia dyeriana]|uniref:Uncharacterized protein n=1 Tax=Dipteronia dyeriana TaxID=168575 RepID=A0AAD9WVF8_9ROSI|nr:hypothetical protein Ddye_019821 [Dipteronia dyeriana]
MCWNDVGQLGFGNEGLSRWLKAENLQTIDEKFKRADTSEKNDWPFHMNFASGRRCYGLLQSLGMTICHKLLSGNHNQFLWSHQYVDDCDIAQVQSLRSVGVKTSQVMDHLLDQSGSYAIVGHTRKDLQNRWDTICRSVSCNSDADSIISYMTLESKMDPGFFFRYSILDDGSIGNLFWVDAMS